MERKKIVCLLFILAITIFFRVWKLGEIPPGIHPDAARNGIDALDAIKTNDYKVFYPENFGREGLFINLTALSLKAFGIYPFSLEIVSAIIGILTVIGAYFLTKEFYNERIALIASFLLATSFWHVLFSRLGLRGIMVPFTLVFLFYFFLRGLKRESALDFLIAGVFLGLGFHTYPSFRMTILILPLLIIPYWKIYKENKKLRKYITLLSCFLFSALIVASPLIIYFLKNPEYFSTRANDVFVFNQENAFKKFLISTISHLGMFNIYGDQNWRHNFSEQPMLPCCVGVCFVGGIITIIWRLFSQKEKLINLFLLSWFLIMLLPGILTFSPGGVPHALRTLGVVPVVYIFAAIFLDFLINFFLKNCEIKYQKIILGFFLLFLIYVGAIEGKKYFYDWGQNYKVRESFFENFVNAAYYLKNFQNEICVSDRANEMEFITYNNKNIHYFFPSELQKIKNFCDKPKSIIVIIDYNLEKKVMVENILNRKLIQEEDLNFGLGGKTLKIFKVSDVNPI
jgi:4-amino-4-deoxy-L-arabinose transferase-like glycosyltransferase